MKKREFLKTSGVLALGTVLAPLAACGGDEKQKENDKKEEKPVAEALPTFEQRALPYAYDALAPHIDAETMEIHYSKHHAGYVRKLNKAMETADAARFGGKDLKGIFAALTDDDKDTNIRNNGGGHYNHTLFWDIMSPNGGGAPQGALADALNGSFGDFETFRSQFIDAALGQFGSGWAWLIVDAQGKLAITSTPNQDNPLMTQLEGITAGTPILGVDVWEHAYYLHYQNLRKKYVEAFFNVIDWEHVAARLNNVG